MLKGDIKDFMYFDDECWVYFVDRKQNKQELYYQIFSLEK